MTSEIQITQIRVTNISKKDIEIDFNDIINGVDLSSKDILYNFEGVFQQELKKEEVHHIRITSTDVLKSLVKIIKPNVKLSEFKGRTNKIINIPFKTKINQIKLIMSKMNHIVISFYHEC